MNWVHALVVILGLLPLILGVMLILLAGFIFVAADRIKPNSTKGNCWALALPKWLKGGGYLVIRRAYAPAGLIPHVMWAPNLPEEMELFHTQPLIRAKKWWQVYKMPYFNFRILNREQKP